MEGTILEQRIKNIASETSSLHPVYELGGQKTHSARSTNPTSASPRRGTTPKDPDSDPAKLAQLVGEKLVREVTLINLNKNMHMYTPELLLEVKSTLCDYNHFYGYTDAERRATGISSPTAFFTYKEGDASEETINGYKTFNASEKFKAESEPQP